MHRLNKGLSIGSVSVSVGGLIGGVGLSTGLCYGALYDIGYFFKSRPFLL